MTPPTLRNHNNIITKGSSLNLMLNNDPNSTDNGGSTGNSNCDDTSSEDSTRIKSLRDYPVIIIPGHFKDKRVVLTDPEILFNKDALNYRDINSDPTLSSLQKREKKKKIIQLATDFYNINNSNACTNNRDVEKGAEVFGLAKVSSRAVADYFGIPKQSFNDHITGKHLNSAVHGPQTKSLINDVEFEYLQNVLNLLKCQFNQRFPEKTFVISNKFLQYLINLALIRSHITKQDLNALDYAISNQSKIQGHDNNTSSNDSNRRTSSNSNSNQNDQLDRHLTVLQILSKLLKEDISDSNQITKNKALFQLFDTNMLEDLVNQLIKFLKLPSIVSSINNNDLNFPKTFSKSTLNRLRKRLGLLRQETKSTQIDTYPSNHSESLNSTNTATTTATTTANSNNITLNDPIIENSNTLKRKMEIQDDTELNQFTYITSMLTSMQKQLDTFSKTFIEQEIPLNRQRFDSVLEKMTCIITDKDLGSDTITKINNYRKLRLELLELLKEIKGPQSMDISLVNHIGVASEVILKLVFENVRLKKNPRNLSQILHNNNKMSHNKNNNNNLNNILSDSIPLPYSNITNSNVQQPMSTGNPLSNQTHNDLLTYDSNEMSLKKRQKI